MNIFRKQCRLCTSYENVPLTLHNLDLDNITFSDKLNEIAPEILEDVNNELPNGICETCIVQLNNAYKFKKKCFRSQEILKQNLKELRNREIIKEGNPERCEENEINLENRNCKTQINCDKFAKESDLINRENIGKYNNTGTFEFISVGESQDNKFLQETNESKIEENTINFKENISNIKEEPIDEYMANNSEAITDTITKEENNLDCENFVYIKSDIIKESNNEIMNKVSSKNTKTNKYVKSGGNISNIPMEGRFSCEECEESFRSKVELSVHRNVHEHVKSGGNISNIPVEGRFSCEECEESFRSKLELSMHRNTHKVYNCNICNKSFKSGSGLVYHVRSHTNERPFKCNLCDKSFIQKVHLKVHIRSHKNEKEFKCHICKKGYNENGYLKVHIQTHYNKTPFKCEICGKGFSRKPILQKHIIRTHTNKSS